MDNQTVLGFIYVTFAFAFLTFAIVVKKPHEIEIDRIEKDQIFQEYIKEGNKIKAVKRCREITMCSLKDANDYVESKING